MRFFALLVLVPTVASAQPSSIEADDRGAHTGLAGTVGLLTPTGELGVEFTAVPDRHLELALGAGIGLSGVQVSVMPRLRASHGAMTFTVGAGVSGGHLTVPVLLCFDDAEDCMSTEATAAWANVEVGIQATTKGGAFVRGYGGAGKLIMASNCTGPDCDTLGDLVLPYGGLAIGHTFQ